MQGASPLAFPALNRLRHLQSLPCWCPEASLASPALDRLRHLQSLLSRCPAGGCSPCGTCSPRPGGEDHLKRRSSSPPVPPLLGCRHCPEDRISVGFASNWRRRRLTPRSNTGLAGRASAARVQPRGCKGRSPLHENNLSPPLPAGKGGGGIGAKNLLYGRKNRRGRTQPPAGNHNGRSSQCRAGSAPGMQGAKPLA